MFFAETVHGDILRKRVLALFEADHMDALAVHRELFDPSMEKAEDRVCLVDRLREY